MVRTTVKNCRFSSKDWDSVRFGMTWRRSQFYMIPIEFQMIFKCKCLSNVLRLWLSYSYSYLERFKSAIGFSFIRINLRSILNTAIDSLVAASSFDLWICISQNIVTFRLDRGERNVKGVARFARVKLALAGWFIDSVPFPLYSLPFTRFAHALHIT